VRHNPELFSGTGDSISPHQATSPTDWVGVPVIFDEVFTGVYRLGRFNCNSFLQAEPDIVVNAKLLTGGLVPLCTTTASQAIYDAFLGESKTDALLHGHSYTAHAVGCQVAVESLNLLEKTEGESWWRRTVSHNIRPNNAKSKRRVVEWSVWDQEFLKQISLKESVEGVIALGSVLAITLVDRTGGGL